MVAQEPYLVNNPREQGMTRRTGTDPTLSCQNVSGEILLIAAVLRQALTDAAVDIKSAQRQDAILFLRDQERVSWWAALTGADGEALGETLRRSAGLE